ncbi:F-box/kelch-repeat protein At1g80440-like [Vitis riparia]|uniref:F-box/kelch-repeat protein At1g80440-like n=1 Tax=Vitis riparia TaxID=96939 RepID=UPI00155B19F7|nr:F-box/kelch-repeat protein At1g80440-like [Vitis riparia]
MDFIPGLPDDVARQCLIRVSYEKFSTIAAVCRVWKSEVEDPDFFRQRKTAGYTRPVFAMAQARVVPNRSSGGMKCPTLAYRVTLLDLETGNWSELPPVPGFSDGLPMFCQLVGVESELVVVGGWDPDTWEISSSVFIYNFLSATWRRGADMPGARRSFFGCAASGLERVVYVAGGHDGEKNALKSAQVYDVAKDEWAPLPDMARERDECKGVFHRGKFHVIGGYCTEMQGRFERSAEAFDFANWEWNKAEEDFLEDSTCPRTCVDGGDMGMYMCHAGEVVALQDSRWQTVDKLPAEIRHTAYMTTWEGKLLVIGCRSFGEAHVAYMLDLKSHRWRKLVAAEEFCGHVQSGCCLEI